MDIATLDGSIGAAIGLLGGVLLLFIKNKHDSKLGKSDRRAERINAMISTLKALDTEVKHHAQFAEIKGRANDGDHLEILQGMDMDRWRINTKLHAPKIENASELTSVYRDWQWAKLNYEIELSKDFEVQDKRTVIIIQLQSAAESLSELTTQLIDDLIDLMHSEDLV